MKLYSSPTSPYVRKVMVVAIEAGIETQIERIGTDISQPDSQFQAHNPLSKVPALVAADGLVLFDSRVICEYLDSLHHGHKLFPDDPAQRWPALRRQALADGILDAAVLCRLEVFLRPESMRFQPWIERHWSKVQRGLDALEAEAGALAASPLSIGHVAAGCALGFLDFRFAEMPWREGRPLLDAWFATMADRVSMSATMPRDPA
jgi:glutathione S-transferase